MNSSPTNVPAAPRPGFPAWVCPALVALWFATSTAGALIAVSYEMTPASTRPAAPRWPGGTVCRLSGSRPTLLMFAHPRCPCTRASLDELAKLVSHCRDRIDVQLIFFLPEAGGAEWAETDLWNSAERIPGATLLVDRGGAERRRFGARVSGEVFLYSPEGALEFHGGITAGRGHVGDNPGRAILETLVAGGAPADRETPTFGCGLTSSCTTVENPGPVEGVDRGTARGRVTSSDLLDQ